MWESVSFTGILIARPSPQLRNLIIHALKFICVSPCRPRSSVFTSEWHSIVLIYHNINTLMYSFCVAVLLTVMGIWMFVLFFCVRHNASLSVVMHITVQVCQDFSGWSLGVEIRLRGSRGTTWTRHGMVTLPEGCSSVISQPRHCSIFSYF